MGPWCAVLSILHTHVGVTKNLLGKAGFGTTTFLLLFGLSHSKNVIPLKHWESYEQNLFIGVCRLPAKLDSILNDFLLSGNLFSGNFCTTFLDFEAGCDKHRHSHFCSPL